MTAPTIASDDYLDRVRLALEDLPAPDRDDLLEDLQGHLEEVRAEDPRVDLLRRLGDPGDYALELRLAAGLPPRDDSGPRPSMGERVSQTRLALAGRVRSWPFGAAALDFVLQLRPAWWLVRAYGAVVVLEGVLRRARGYGSFDTAFPSLHRSRELGLLALVVLAVASIALGRRRLTGTARVLVVVANVVLALAAVAHLRNATQYRSYSDVTHPQPCCGSLYGPQGDPITNLYGYDENGRLIPRMQLFDQNGQPINLTDNVSPGAPIEVLHNVFPQQTFNEDFGPDGSPVFTPRPVPSIAVPRLPSAAPTASPPPSPVPSPAPTG
jgi:uncharacterized membrane protein